MKEEGTPSVSQAVQEKEKTVPSASVVADSQVTPAAPSGQKEGEQEEAEMEETPVKAARTARKTPQRSRCINTLTSGTW